MILRKIISVLILSLLTIFNLYGINFSDLNLSGDRLLFRAEFESQQMLFLSRLGSQSGSSAGGMTLQQLTAFPEKLTLVDNGRTILALSRFGAVRIPAAGGLPIPLPGLPSFASGDVPLKGRGHGFAASADGRWIVYAEPTSAAYGNLMMVDISNGVKWKICERMELPSLDFPACWSPDSRFFIYEKGGRLFYYPIMNDLSAMADERFRQIGAGGITSVVCGSQGDFFYFSGNILYRVMHSELYTRTIYGDFLSIGTVEAALPFDFDPRFDRFWMAPDSGSVLINKMGKSLFLFMLGENRYSDSVLPHVALGQGACNLNALWSASGQLTIIASMQNETKVWRFEIRDNSVKTAASAGIPLSSDGILSPDGTRVIFWGEKGLELWDYTNWRLIQKLSSDPVFSCVWINNRQFISGNGRFIEEINITGTNYLRRRICLSGAVDEFGFEESSRESLRILAKAGTDWFVSDGRSPWAIISNPQLRNASLASERYRVYLENQPSGPFNNVPMIRNISSFSTFSLVSGYSVNSVYAHDRQMQIALCFDLYDDDTGLSSTLNALNRFNIKATFFMNGDFIRRNPLAASAIAQAGHETASLFYAPIDLSDSRYSVTPEFIAQGLARNEDEFFRATARELSLLWHPPFYRSSALVNESAAASGYVTAARDIDIGDWLSRDDALRLNVRQMSPGEAIELIIENRKNGAVVPVRLGLLSGGRDEYMYQRIDALLDALIRSGCDIVPVSSVSGR
ncbi:MAG: polysaccharide deacetylase family protein [Treponema sp.]|nr:polysaccharide deacetylase family protein [Treponema sp.]